MVRPGGKSHRWCHPFHCTTSEHICGEHTATIKKRVAQENKLSLLQLPKQVAKFDMPMEEGRMRSAHGGNALDALHAKTQ